MVNFGLELEEEMCSHSNMRMFYVDYQALKEVLDEQASDEALSSQLSTARLGTEQHVSQDSATRFLRIIDKEIDKVNKFVESKATELASALAEVSAR